MVRNLHLARELQREIWAEVSRITAATSLIGHHVLTMGLLGEGLLAPDAHIIIAGSEAARGDVPMMGLTAVPQFARDQFGGDQERAFAAIARAEEPSSTRASRTGFPTPPPTSTGCSRPSCSTT